MAKKSKVKNKNTTKNISQNKLTMKASLLSRFAFFIEVIIVVSLAAGLFWLARTYDAFEYLIEISRKHEEWELDEIFTLLMITSVALFIILARNISYLRKEIKRRFIVEEEIKKLAFFDSLTGLPNRDLCNNRLEHTLANALRNSTMAAVLFIDLDNFKEVNDNYGHNVGDQLLKQVAKRLASELRSGDTLARIAGDEFIIVLEAITTADNVSRLAEKLIAKIGKPFDLSDQEVHVGISIGIAMYPTDGDYNQLLIKNADIAMYHSKSEGKNTFSFFSKQLDEQAKEKKKIAIQLRMAMKNKEFTLHFQPIVNAKTRVIKGAEALLRWHNASLGDVGPDIFIPIAEDIGLISVIGDWVLLQACEQTKRWQQQGHSEIVMSVNMSARQLGMNDFVNTVTACLAQTGLDAKYLELELTETTLMKDIKQAMNQLKQFHALGISIALDDFGTGYSSMSYLRKLKLSRLKIDRSFIKNIPQSEEDIMTTQAIISLAYNLKLKITAEGIETKAQQDFIEGTLTDSVQGYYYSKAVCAEEFEQLLISPPWLN